MKELLEKEAKEYIENKYFYVDEISIDDFIAGVTSNFVFELLEKSFDAGSAYATGSHKDFKQTHPNKKEFIEQIKKEIGL